MYSSRREIIGYAIKIKRPVNLSGLTEEVLADIEDLDISYYIGKNGRHLINLPQNPKVLFKTEDSARDHRQRFMHDNNEHFSIIVPVYKKLESNLNVVRRTDVIQPKLLEFRPRKRRNSPENLAENKKRRTVSAKKEAGMIPKLR